MANDGEVRWGILGTAGIAEHSFLPALREAGEGVAAAVASRDRGRAERWAADQGVARGVEGYARVVEDPEIDAIYIPLPNGLHADWTIAALEAGKAVLCEKPLCVMPEETRRVLDVAAASPAPLWEAFVFPFHEQMARIREAVRSGVIGQVREVSSRFHFVLDDPKDIRLSGELGGGSLHDVGCYPIRLARLLLADEPDTRRAIADAAWASSGVDEELWGALAFSGDRRLVFSCGFRAAYDTFSRVLGTSGEIRITNPFHPAPGDTFAIVREGAPQEEHPAAPEGGHSFTPMIRHVHRVLRGQETPSYLAIDDAMGNARAIAALLDVARPA